MRTKIREVLAHGEVGSDVTVGGWVRTRRDSKEFSFLEVNDGSCLSNLQIVAEGTLPEYQTLIPQCHTGCSVRVSGALVQSPGKNQRVELRAKKIELLGAADPEKYPLQKKGHSMEFLREIAHLRPRTNTFGSVFRVRHAASFAVHKFFHERGFVNLHTPIITTSDCEGAGQMFQVTTMNLEQLPKREIKAGGKPESHPTGHGAGTIDFSSDFFSRPASLTVSGQLEAELYALALSDVYTFGPTFRAENSNTSRHLAEFWMIEPEMAFCDLAGDMKLAEDFVRSVLRFVLDSCQEDMKFFDDRIEKGIVGALEKVANADFQHMTYTDAIAVLEKCGKQFEFPVAWGMDIQTEHERYLSEEHVGGPVFITNYPKEIKAFYMRLDEGEKTVSAMDLLVPRLGEIIGGSQREERLDVLERRIVECGLPKENYWWYLDTRRFGTVPHAGFGLGFERLIMYLTGMQNIRDVIPFPRTPGNAEF